MQGIVGNAVFNSLQNKSFFFVSIVPLMLKKLLSVTFCINYVCSLLTLKKLTLTANGINCKTKHYYGIVILFISRVFECLSLPMQTCWITIVVCMFFLNTLFRNTVNATSASTENLSAANKLQRTPSLPRSYSRNRSGIPVAYRDQPQSTIRGCFAKMLSFLLFYVLCFMNNNVTTKVSSSHAFNSY